MTDENDNNGDGPQRDPGGKIYRLPKHRNGFDDNPLQPLRQRYASEGEGLLIPRRQWLIDDWYPLRKVSGLSGPPGVGKSTLLQQLATAMAIGESWLGLPTMPGRSILFLAEDEFEDALIRQAAINRHYNCHWGDFGTDIVWVVRHGFDNTLLTFENNKPKRTPLYYQIEELALEVEPKLFGLDVLADTFAGNANDPVHVRQFAALIANRIAVRTGCAFLVSSHPSRSGLRDGVDGFSVQWSAVYRANTTLRFPPPPDEGDEPDEAGRIFSRFKSNFSTRSESINLVWKDGVFVRRDPPTGVIASIQRRTVERIFLELVDRTTQQGRALSHAASSPDYAPKIFASMPKDRRGGFRKLDFERAMARLLDDGTVIIRDDGKPSRPLRHIVRAGLSDPAK